MNDHDGRGEVHEARQWLAQYPQGYAADGMNVEAPGFVERLYAAGAVEVSVLVRGEFASQMDVVLPPEAGARAALFAIVEEQRLALGEEFAAWPSGRPTHEITTEEAARMGHPDAAGEVIEVDGPFVDIGQTTLALWWD